ncbi:MAG: chemotaxis protein CheW, partial [Nitrospira sp.]|nr:chemotaxis protein CheW [Nitrospira sp.]
MATATLETATKELNQQIGLTTDGSQYLTFQLGDELYGVDILRVQEIKGYTTVTK